MPRRPNETGLLTPTLRKCLEHFVVRSRFAEAMGDPVGPSHITFWTKMGYIPVTQARRVEVATDGRITALMVLDDYDRFIKPGVEAKLRLAAMAREKKRAEARVRAADAAEAASGVEGPLG